MRSGSSAQTKVFVLALVATLFVAGAARAESFVELVTVDVDAAVWVITTEAGAEVAVRVEGEGGALSPVLDSVEGRLHLARLTGLVPGASYDYEVRVGGAVVPTDTWHPGRFTTLVPPGELRFRFATVTDTHVGEHEAGLIGGAQMAGYSWPDPARPYWRFTNEAAVRAINAAGVDFVIHKGDVTAEARAQEIEDALAIFGAFEMPWHVVRGNHDRVHDGVDAFAAGFGLAPTWRAFDHGRHRFLLLDSCRPGTGQPGFAEAQLTWLEAELTTAREALRPTWITLHHGASDKAESLYTLQGEDQQRFLETVAAAAPSVLAVMSGHSHRNARRDSYVAPGVAFVETAATKEYPGYWTEVRVYDRGWLQVSHWLDCPECREWYAMTTGMYMGAAQALKSGTLEDRCFVVPFPEALVEPPAPPVEPVADSGPVSVAELPVPSAASGGGCGAAPSGGGATAALLLTLLALVGLCRRRSR